MDRLRALRLVTGWSIGTLVGFAAMLAPVTALPAAAACAPGTAIGGTVGSPGGPPLELAAGCYVATGDITVPANVTFTLDPGVTLQFNANLGLFVNPDATLIADASLTPALPIVLTTNSPAPAPGQWMGVFVQQAFGALKNVTIAYAGANRLGTQFGIRLDGTDIPLDSVTLDRSSGSGIETEYGTFATITNSRVTNSGGHGVLIASNGCPSISNITVTGNAGYGLNLNSGIQCDPGLSGLSATTYSGNGNGNRIALTGGTLTSTAARSRLPNFGVAYDVTGDISLQTGGTLTIDPGTTLRFAAQGAVLVQNDATLAADSSAVLGSTITFTSANATPAAGQWMGIFIQSSFATLRNVNVQFAGFNRLGTQFAIRVDSSNPTLDNVTVGPTTGFGIETENSSSPLITNSKVSNSTSHGVAINSSSCPTISNITVTNSGGYGLSLNSGIQCDPGLAGLSATTYSGNGNGNRIGVAGGTIFTSGRSRLANFGFPYDVTSDIYINYSGTLTIDPGTSLRFAAQQGILVQGDGNLVADASSTPLTPITFTSASATPAAGQWMGIFFQGSSGRLQNVVLQFAGFNRVGTQFAVRTDNSDPTLDTIIIDQNLGHGVEVESQACPTITNATITNNTGYGLYLNSGLQCDSNLGGLTYTGNGNNNWILLSGSFAFPPLNNQRLLQSVGPDYLVSGDVNIPAPIALTIAPSAILHFGTNQGVLVYGSLIADASADPTTTIVFTNAAAPVAPASVMRGRLVTPARLQPVATRGPLAPAAAVQQWSGIYFVSGTGALRNVALQSPGANRFGTAFGIRIDNAAPTLDTVSISQSFGFGIETAGSLANPTITNSTVTNSAGHGITLDAGCATISNITVTGSGGYGLNLNSGIQCDPLLTGLSVATYSGNGNGNRIGLAGGTLGIIGRTRLANFGTPYDVLSDITIGAGAILNVDPSTTLRFAPNVGLFVQGNLVADASSTPTTPITFTSASATPAAGQWMGVWFSGGGTGTLRNLVEQFAGANRIGTQFGIRMDSASPLLDTVNIGPTTGYGIEVEAGSTPTISNSTVTNSSSHGVHVNGCPSITNITVTGSGGYGLNLNSGIQCDPLLSGLSPAVYSGNGNGNRIGLAGGSITTTGRSRLANFGIAYDVFSTIYVNAGASLTVDPGATLRFAANQSLYISGKLTADASSTPTTPITFTTASATPAAGQWVGLYIQSGAEAVLRRVVVQYAGAPGLGDQFGIRVDGNGTQPAWSAVTLANNAGTGLDVTGGANIVITGSNFRNGPTAKGIVNNGTTNSIDARNSYWNSASGPTIASNPAGTGDAIAGPGASRVLYQPFSATPN